jgi:hypothetical protein
MIETFQRSGQGPIWTVVPWKEKLKVEVFYLLAFTYNKLHVFILEDVTWFNQYVVNRRMT